MRRIAIVRRRGVEHAAAPYRNDPEKRAAYELLHGPVDWEEIARSAALAQARLEKMSAEENDEDDDIEDFTDEDEGEG